MTRTGTHSPTTYANATRGLANALAYGATSMVRYFGADRLMVTNDGNTFIIEFNTHTGAAHLVTHTGIVLRGTLARMAADARTCHRYGR